MPRMRVLRVSVLVSAVFLLFNNLRAQDLGPDAWSTAAIPGAFTGCCSSGSSFVVVGPSGMLVYSADATNWTFGYVERGAYLTGVAFGNGAYIAVGFRDVERTNKTRRRQGTVWFSTDLVQWKASAQETYGIRSISFNEGRFAIVGENGLVAGSRDGVNWRPLILAGVDSFFESAVYGRGKFVIVSGEKPSKIFTVDDSGNCTTNVLENAEGLRSVRFENGVFLAAGGIKNPELLTSVDGVDWKGTDFGQTINPDYTWLTALAYGGGEYLAIRSDGALLSSKDTKNWHVESGLLVKVSVRGLCFGASRFLAVGSGPKIWLSRALAR